MNPFRSIRNYLSRTTPGEAVIKRTAHAATVVVCALIVPSLCAIYFRRAGIEENEPYWVWASLTVWKIHAVSVVVALFFWIVEKPRLTPYLSVESTDGEQIPKGGKPNHRATRQSFSASVSMLSVLCLIAGLSTYEVMERGYANWGARPIRAVGYGIGALIMLCVTAFLLRMLVLVIRHRPRKSSVP